MKILLATDGSEYSNAAVQEIAGRPFPPNTKVHIVTAFESSPLIMSAPSPMGGLAGFYEKTDVIARRLADETVNEAAKLIKAKNSTLTISTAVIKGSPKHVILNEAEVFGAALIVVGSHGRGVIGSFLLGSVSQAVAQHASCSVEIVRKRGKAEESK